MTRIFSSFPLSSPHGIFKAMLNHWMTKSVPGFDCCPAQPNMLTTGSSSEGLHESLVLRRKGGDGSNILILHSSCGRSWIDSLALHWKRQGLWSVVDTC